jgi:hypothetical protein
MQNIITTPGPAHDYLSAACYHGAHDECRWTCKFCLAVCRCPCGHKEALAPDEMPEKR